MDDLISRQAAINALEEPPKVPDTWSDESAIGEREQWEKDVKALNSLPSAQPDVPDTNVGDMISRQAAIEALEMIGSLDTEADRKYARSVFEALPSAQPETPPYVAEIESEYKKCVSMPHINKPLAKALYEVWKKHDRGDVSRNE